MRTLRGGGVRRPRSAVTTTEVSSVASEDVNEMMWAHRLPSEDDSGGPEVSAGEESPRVAWGDTSDSKPGSRLKGKPAFKPAGRQLPSYVMHFVEDDGKLSKTIDLEAHRSRARAPVNNAIVQELADMIPSMTSLNLTGCSEVTDVGLWALSRTCTDLRELRLKGVDQITHVGLRALSLRCKDMRVLDLSHCVLVNDLCIRVVAAGMWRLEEVNLAGSKVTDIAIAELSSCCKNLQHVDFSDMKHVGDHGLAEIARNCTQVQHLDLHNVVFVKGPGLEAVAVGNKSLNHLDVGGNPNIPLRVFYALADNCSTMQYLNLDRCAKLDSKALCAMVANMPNLTYLNVSGCHLLNEKGFKCLATHCGNLVDLEMRNLPLFKATSCVAMARGCTALRSLDLSGCVKLSESGVKALVIGMSRLTELRLDKCERVTRPFVRALAKELPYVENSRSFFGLAALPDAAERITMTERRRGQVAGVTTIQRVTRGFLDRKRVRAIRRWILENQSATAMSKVWRAYRDRRMVRRLALELSREESALKIQSCTRGWFGRRRARLWRWRRDMWRQRTACATLIQSVYRGHLARMRVEKLLLQRFLEDQEERRLGEKKRRCATKIAGFWKVQMARNEVKRRREALRQARLLLMRQIAGATQLQRLWRGHIARSLRRTLEANMWSFIREGRAAVIIQCCVRQFLSKCETGRRRAERERLRRLKAATDIQRVWRGSRGRHIFALLLSLRALHAVEQAAALRIQTKWRTYKARKFLKFLQQLQREQMFRERMATQIQKAFRGLKGRQVAEITRNIKEMRGISAPLQKEIAELDTEERAVRRKFEEVERRITLTEERLMTWQDEHVKLQTWGKKHYDSDKLTGTTQRYETEFLREALTGQMAAFHQTLGQLRDQLEEVTYRLHDVNRRLRGKRRDLVPLERGIVARTLVVRRQRLADRKALEARSSSVMCALYRGWKVRKLARLGLLPEPREFDGGDAEGWEGDGDDVAALEGGEYDAYGGEYDAHGGEYGGYYEEAPVADAVDVYAKAMEKHKTRGQIMAMGPEYGEDHPKLRDAMLEDGGHPELPFKEEDLKVEVPPDPEDGSKFPPCVPRDPDTGEPTVHIPHLLKCKLDVLDKEAYPYRERRAHVRTLRQNVKDKEWLLVASTADEMIATQRLTREKKHQLRAKKARQEAVRLLRNEQRRVEYETMGMTLADRESARFERDVKAFRIREANRVRAEFAAWQKGQREEMAKEDYWSFRVEKVYRAWKREERQLRLRAREQVQHKLDRRGMTQADEEGQAVKAAWAAEHDAAVALRLANLARELEDMGLEDVGSAAANVLWRRVEVVQEQVKLEREAKVKRDKATRARLFEAKQKAKMLDSRRRMQRLAAGLPASSEEEEDEESFSEVTIEGEEEEEEEDEEKEEDAGEGEGGHPSDVEQEEPDLSEFYEGELERGRAGWISLCDDDGYVYFHNEVTGLTQWERPAEF